MITYEWTIEENDEFGDIIDSDFADKLCDFTSDQIKSLSNSKYSLALVRNEGDEVNGLEDRYWAYVKNGDLELKFSDGAFKPIDINVPKKYLIEFNKFFKK